MTAENQIDLPARLRLLGFAIGNEMKLYGETLVFVSDPIIAEDDVVLVDATEKKSGSRKRIRIPLTVVHMARAA